MSDENVDTRVVELDFDNKKFEKNVKQTQSSLDDLNKSLRFDGVSSSIDTVIAKFSMLDVAAATIVTNLTNRIVNLGVQLVKSLSVDQLSAGWTKFGQKTTSMATIASQTIKIAGQEITDYSEKLKAINEQLEMLNWYTDETSYDFTDMVDNIGKFTAAGQDLDVSVKAMMGIANWAALSGQNATMAGRAMYNLAQALGKGYVQLIDWKSIQNANMDTQEFRQTALETAVALGELTQEGENYITKTGKKFTRNQFAEELSEKWFTSDVLTKTLSKYSSAVERIYEIAEETGMTASEVMARYGDELDKFGLKAFKAAQEARTFTDALSSVKDAVSTGWMNTAEKIFGGYEETKELWTDLANELYNVFASGGDFRNEILSIWKDLGGRSDLFKHGGSDQGAFWNIFDAIVAVIDTIKSSFNDIFPLSAFDDETDKANDLASKFKVITGRLKDWSARVKEAVSENSAFANILRTVFSAVKIGLTAVNGIRYAIDPIVSVMKTLIKDVFSRISYYLSDLSFMEGIFNTIVEYSNKVSDVLTDLFDSFDISSTLDKVIGFFSDLFKEFSKANVVERFTNTIKLFFKSLSNNGKTLIEFKNIIRSITTLFGKLATFAMKLVGIVTKYILPVISSLIDFLAQISGSALATLIEIVSNILQLIAGLIDLSDIAKKISDAISAFKFGDIMDSLKPLSTFTSGMITLLKGLLVTFKALLPVITSTLTFLGNVFTTIGNILMALFGSGKGTSGLIVAALVLATLVLVQIIVIVVSLKKVFNVAKNTIESVQDVLNSFSASLKANVFKQISQSMLMLAASIALLGMMSTEQLVKATIVFLILAATMVALLALCNVLNKKNVGKVEGAEDSTKAFTKLAKGLLKMAVAIKVFSIAMNAMGQLNKEQMTMALIGLAAVIVSLKAMSGVIENISTKKMIAASAVMTVLGAAIKAMANAFAKFNGITWDAVGKGLTSFIAVLAAFTVASESIENVSLSTLFSFTGTIIALSATLYVMAGAMAIFSKIDWAGIGKGLTTLAGVAAVLVVSANLMKTVKPSVMLSLSASMIVLSVALVALSAGMAIFSAVPLEGIGKGLLSLAGAMAALVIAAKVLKTSDIGVLLALPASMILLAAAIASLAAAFSLFAAVPLEAIGLGLLTIAGVLVLLGAATLLVPNITSTMYALSVLFLSLSASLLIGAIAFKLITSTMGAFATEIGPFLSAILDALIENSDKLAILVETMVSNLLDTIVSLSTKIASAIGTVLESLLLDMVQRLPTILKAIANLITQILEGLLYYVPQWVKTLMKTVTAILNAITSELNNLIDAMVNFIVTFICSLLDSLGNNMERVLDSAVYFIINTINALGNALGNAGGDLGKALANLGKNIIKGLWNGMVEWISTLIEGCGWIGEKIAGALRDTLKIHSPSRLTYEMGEYLMMGLSNGMIDSTDETANEAADTMSDVVEAIGDTITNGVDDDSLTITPVLDLSNVQSGAQSISSMMSNISGGTIGTSVRLADAASSEINASKAANTKNQNGANTTNNSSTENYYSTFNVTTDDPEEFARQADTLLQKMRIRSNLAKGGV